MLRAIKTENPKMGEFQRLLLINEKDLKQGNLK